MSASRARRTAFAILFSFSLVLGIAPPAAAVAAPPRPGSMAATGDSITRAFNLCIFPFTDCVARSWSTGSNSTVNSHARRLNITGSAFNDARSGAKMIDLEGQATTVASRSVGYVTILMGGNDVCTETEGAMTSPGDYEAQFRRAMNVLASRPGGPPLVYVVSIPNVKTLWEILKDNSSARSAWNSYDICQSLLANPLSTEQTDIDRRERVKQRNMDLNQRLRKVCAEAAFASFCRFDGEASFGTPFVPNDVSTRDYFHPSTAGQAKLADVSFRAGYWAATELQPVNAPPTAAFAPPSCTVGVACTFVDNSSDPDGIGGRSWQFGDGSTATTPTAVHTFSSVMTYEVTLYSIDTAGATSAVTHEVQVTAAGDDTTPPAAPTGLTATAGDSSVHLAWTPNTEADLAGYEVYRSESGSPYTMVGSTAQPSFDDTGLTNGTTYAYVVKAVDTTGNPSQDSAPASATPSSSTGGGTVAMHVADLDGVSQIKGKSGKWEAFVTVTVVDSAGERVGGAAVTATWSGAASGTATLSTGSDGTVTFGTGTLSGGTSVTFTVDSISRDGFVYESTSNRDGDGDSNGTTITVAR